MPISWRANKIKRVVHSTLAAESLALAEGLEEAVFLKALLSEVIPDLRKVANCGICGQQEPS